MREPARSDDSPTLTRHAGAAIALLGAAALGAWLSARRAPPYSFRGRVVVITGGSRGLGLALARAFAAEGARLYLVARSAPALRNAVETLDQGAGSVVGIPCDVTRPDDVTHAIGKIGSDAGRIDVLVNNAGIIQSLPFDHATSLDFDDALDTHFWAALSLIRECLPWMRDQREGRIVNIASIGGRIGVPHMAPYCASKFALVGLSETLRAELAPENIVVTTVCPGLMRTGSFRNVLVRGRHRQEAAWFALASAVPIATIPAARAAQAIVEACRRGDARVTPGWPARLADLTTALAPELMATVMAWAARAVLPRSTPAPDAKVLRSSRDIDLGWLEPLLPRRAAVDLNQPQPHPR